MKTKFLKSAHSRIVAALLVGSAFAASSAMAAIDLTADITAAKTDVTTNGTAVLGVIVSVAVIGWIRRILR